MNTAEEIFIVLFEQAQLARKFKFRFDLFWNKEVSYRASARMSYLIRHTVLLSCFEGLLLLFCSREMWEHGGIGAWATEKDIPGPIQLLSHEDNIDKMVLLCEIYRQDVINILALHQLPLDRQFLLNEISNITSVVKLAFDNYNTAYPNSI